MSEETKKTSEEQEAEKEEATRKLAENVSGEVNSASVGKEKLDEASELTRSGEMESQDTSTETEKKEAVNINETDFGASPSQKSWRIQTWRFSRTRKPWKRFQISQKHPIIKRQKLFRKRKRRHRRKVLRNPIRKCKRRHRRKVFRNPIRKHRQKHGGKILKNPPGKSGKRRFQILHQTIKKHFSQALKIKNNRNQIHPRNFPKKIPPRLSGTACALPIRK